ncbi:SpoIVB peptidase [Hazenella sp. IB182353]|uniref:SpoIVB peptidase n=1 Tax=Polycladospora coralii TaxID=2771432 RepID=UPI001745F824|nr:SpoIVB peptidase [Polycladospora coralii]MBS7530920.1 SpoIVB peptidase [Polycladospora coralii]
MEKRDKKKWLGFLLVLLLIMGSTTSVFHQFTSFPKEMRLVKGQLQQLDLSMPVSATASVSKPDILQVNGSTQSLVPINLKHPLMIQPQAIGQTFLTLKLFGSLPIKRVNVQVLPDLQVIPGGQTIGVKLKSSGALVVGHHQVQSNQSVRSPAEKADIRRGDYLTEMNGMKIKQVSDVARTVNDAGRKRLPIQVTLMRDGKEKQVNVHPVYNSQEDVYQLGLYIRDSAAGVGTLTFYEPQKKAYGALGHVITDVDTGQAISVGDGQILQSDVTSIEKGKSGDPGEKRAIFLNEDQVMGNISNNTQFGIFGKMSNFPQGGIQSQPMPVGLAEQVEEGPAQIYTVVEGQTVKAYDIEIVHTQIQKSPATKGLIIKVTDPELLAKTGGIVQGMSGSPIIQNGKLVGAVTHVFVNDPTSGYGTFIEWMLQDAGVLNTSEAEGSFWESSASEIVITCTLPSYPI